MQLFEALAMNLFDIITIVALVWALISGWRSGFVSQLLGLVGIILGIVLSLRYGAAVGELFNIDARFSIVAGFLITFVATLVLATILARLLSKILSFIGLGWVNTLLGIVLSTAKSVVVLSMLYTSIFALNTNLKFVEPEYFNKSISFDIIRELAEPLLDYWNESKQILVNPKTTTV